MRIHDRIGAFIREPHTRDRRAPEPGVPAGFAGGAWGRGSAFAGSLQKQYEDGGPLTEADPLNDPWNAVEAEVSGDPPEYKRIIPGQLKIYSREARISEGGDPEAGTYVDVDRFQRLMFYFTEFPAKSIPQAFQPSFTTYYDLHFSLHPVENETEL